MKDELNRQILHFLCCVPGIGDRTILKLYNYFKSYEKIYEADRGELQKILMGTQLDSFLETRSNFDLQGSFRKLLREGIGFVTVLDEDYPGRLMNIPDPPHVLYYKGRLPREDVLSVAVIGARDCSEYGKYVAAELGKALGQNGIAVISGMARGIDGLTQKAALDVNGCSYGILGCGVDICYPRQNMELYECLKKKGGIISAYPPGMPAKPQNFPPRNRIVSGLSDAVVVVEARQKSGTLITVDMALEQGREVYIVPGRVTDRLSDGCNKLIKQGAGVFLSPDDFIMELSESIGTVFVKKSVVQKPCDENKETGLPEKIKCIYDKLDYSPQTIQKIRSDLTDEYTESEVFSTLMQLCVKGLARQISPGQFCLSGSGK